MWLICNVSININVGGNPCFIYLFGGYLMLCMFWSSCHFFIIERYTCTLWVLNPGHYPASHYSGKRKWPLSWSSLALSWQVLMEANLVASTSTCVLGLEIEKLECIQMAASGCGPVELLLFSWLRSRIWCYSVDYVVEFERIRNCSSSTWVIGLQNREFLFIYYF